MKDRRQQNNLVRAVQRAVFFILLAAMGLVGLAWFARPAVSQVEKRELTAFPVFSVQSLLDGSFFKGIDTWYADTYPMREGMIYAQQQLEDHYGQRGTQLISGGATAVDEIPLPADDIPGPAEQTADQPAAAPTPIPSPTKEPRPDGTVHEIGEFNGSIYITGGAAYGLYGFSQYYADQYIATMNQIYQNIGGKVDMYVMNVPQSSAVMLDDEVKEDMGCSDEAAAIDYIVSGLDPGIHALDVCDALKEHNAEYIYFRTDHHWTQLGAYYAYRVFCEEKGIVPHELDQFRTAEFGAGEYLGSYYVSADRPAALAAHPDTVQAWYPMCVNADDPNDMDMHIVESSGNEYDWRIINDLYEFPASEWYCIFSGTDQPFSSLHNPNITDGSAVLVVKDSYGNAFIPWLVDHYEYTYWVDFRYTDETVSHMVETYGVQDVIFEAGTFNATGGLCNELFLDIGS